MGTILVVVGALVLLPALLYFEKNDQVSGKLITKTPLSLLFIAAAVIQTNPKPGYYPLLLGGLVLCLGGDVLLIFPQRKAFLLGLVSFLLGHLLYVGAFFKIASLSALALAVSLPVLIISAIVFKWLKPRLGSMLVPVIFYIVVITAMVIGAGTVLLETGLPPSGRYVVFAGALMFYFSDLFVARQRFVTQAFVNRLCGLPLYYGGQFLLAFSAGMLGS